MLRAKFVSSLEKCFLDEKIFDKAMPTYFVFLKNEIFSLQICFDREETVMNHLWVNLEIETPLKEFLKIYRVRHIPSSLPVFRDRSDDYYIRKTPGLYPDLLEPWAEGYPIHTDNNLNSLWLEFSPNGNVIPGVYPMTVRFRSNETKEIEAEISTELTIVDAELPKQELIYTQWFYPDCICNYYNIPFASEKFWQITEDFFLNAVRYGQNMILTPLLTTVLNSAAGKVYRNPHQLIGVKKENGKYSFDFSLLGRWVDLCDKVGFKYFEIGHLFSQSGAEFCPAVYADVDGEKTRFFGWNMKSDDPEYLAFLEALIPETLRYLREEKNGADRRCWFHISDEPSEEHLECFKKLKCHIKRLIGDLPIFDALYDYDYYTSGVVEHPVPATDRVGTFIEGNVPDLWTYNCGWQVTNHLSNRFFAMPSARNRILGIQLYKYGMQGFLHWGYNYYNSQGSYYSVNPFVCSDGEGWVPSGDCYSVYPGPNGTPWPSLRQIVFNEGLQDLRLLKLCEEKFGKERVMAELEKGIEPITFENYPTNSQWILNLRQRLIELAVS